MIIKTVVNGCCVQLLSSSDYLLCLLAIKSFSMALLHNYGSLVIAIGSSLSFLGLFLQWQVHDHTPPLYCACCHRFGSCCEKQAATSWGLNHLQIWDTFRCRCSRGWIAWEFFEKQARSACNMFDMEPKITPLTHGPSSQDLWPYCSLSAVCTASLVTLPMHCEAS